MARSLNLFCHGAVGFVDWLGGRLVKLGLSEVKEQRHPKETPTNKTPIIGNQRKRTPTRRPSIDTNTMRTTAETSTSIAKKLLTRLANRSRRNSGIFSPPWAISQGTNWQYGTTRPTTQSSKYQCRVFICCRLYAHRSNATRTKRCNRLTRRT